MFSVKSVWYYNRIEALWWCWPVINGKFWHFPLNVSLIPYSLSNKHLTSLFLSIVFFVLFYLYLWFYVDLRLIYSCGGIVTNFPVFTKGWVFFRDHISHPGGAIEYISAFLSQLFYIGWAGALVVTVQAWSMSACAWGCGVILIAYVSCLLFLRI